MANWEKLGGLERLLVFAFGVFVILCLLSYVGTCDSGGTWDVEVVIHGGETDQVTGSRTVRDGGETDLVASFLFGGAYLSEIWVNGVEEDVPQPEPVYHEGERGYYPSFRYGPVTEDLRIVFVFGGGG